MGLGLLGSVVRVGLRGSRVYGLRLKGFGFRDLRFRFSGLWASGLNLGSWGLGFKASG